MNPISEETGQAILGVLREIRDDQKKALATAKRAASGPPHGASMKLEPFTEAEIKGFGQWGDPEIKKDPKKWGFPSIAGRYMSQLPSDVLRAYAESCCGLAAWHDSKGNVDGKGNPSGDWSRKDAKKALYWAAKNEGKNAVVPEVAHDDDPDWGGGNYDADVPF